MNRPSFSLGPGSTLLIATVVSLALYSHQAALLLLKVGEVFNGVFDTSVPAFPLAGMLFVLMFIYLRRKELGNLLLVSSGNRRLRAGAVVLALLPLPALVLMGPELDGSFAYAAAALTTCWVGVMAALRPSTFRFLWPYLVLYVTAIGSVSALTSLVGDPLAIVVASISSVFTWLLHLPVQWSSVYITFPAAGGSDVYLFISQECSGIASISIFLLLVGLCFIKKSVRPSLLPALRE